jgi:hypothetical protein
MDILSLFTNNAILLVTIIGVLAFLVSVITEVTKKIGFLAKIPTDFQVIVLSIVLCQVAYFAYTSKFSIEIQWYYVAGCFIAAFIVSFISMYGWEKFTTLYNRFVISIKK